MTLDEAIMKYKKEADKSFLKGAKNATVECLRIVGWLEELREFRETDTNLGKLDTRTLQMGVQH